VENYRTTLEWFFHDHPYGKGNEHSMFSNASGSWGCGAWFNTKWFQLQWDERTEGANIAVKEIIPIVIAVVLRGHRWKRSRVFAHCENTSLVAVINSHYSKDNRLMQMLRCLFFIEATYQSAEHIAGVRTTLPMTTLELNLPHSCQKLAGVTQLPNPMLPRFTAASTTCK
jgi:hypothetical protein